MERSVIKAIIRMCAKAILVTAVIGIIIGIIGYSNQWNSPIAYSNAFFVAGCLVIIAGTSSRFAAGRDIGNYQLINAKSFRDMSSGERIDYIVNANSPIRTVVLGLLTGLLLGLISAIAAMMS